MDTTAESADERALIAPRADTTRSPSDGSVQRLGAAVQTGDLDAVTAVLRRSWFELLSSHSEEARRILDRTDASRRSGYPLISMMLALTYNATGYRRIKAALHFSAAIRGGHSVRARTDAVDRALIHVSEAAAYRLLGMPRKGVAAARAAQRELASLTPQQRSEISQLPRLHTQIGMTLYYSGMLDDAMEAFEHGVAESPDSPPSPGFGSLAMLAGIHALRGNGREAAELIDLAVTGPWTDEQRSMYSGTFYRIAEAILALERRDVESARAHMQAMVHDRRSIEHWTTIASIEALIEILDGRPGAGLAALDGFAAMRGREARSADARSALAPVRILASLALANPAEAEAVMHRDLPVGPVRHLVAARILLSRGEVGAALGELAMTTGALKSPRARAEAAALEAAALLRRSSPASAARAVERLGALLSHSGMQLPVLLLPGGDAARVVERLGEAGFAELFAGVTLPEVVPDTSDATGLTKRELVVLDALTRSASAGDIAAELYVSVNTIKTQLRNLYRKLGVSSRDDALRAAGERNLLVLARAAGRSDSPQDRLPRG